INQDPAISAQFTLLDQSGSRVIAGNLLVIPVEQTVLYVQPVYLQATGTGGAPTELKFVIVATSQQVEMRPTLEEALAAGSGAETGGGEPGASAAGETPASGAPLPTPADALAAFESGQKALQKGDWAAYGEAQAELERIPNTLAGKQVAMPSVPASATP